MNSFLSSSNRFLEIKTKYKRCDYRHIGSFLEEDHPMAFHLGIQLYYMRKQMLLILIPKLLIIHVVIYSYYSLLVYKLVSLNRNNNDYHLICLCYFSNKKSPIATSSYWAFVETFLFRA